MSEVADVDRPAEKPLIQVRLADLVAWVVAAALVLTVARAAGFKGWPKSVSEIELFLDGAGVALAVFFGLAMLRQTLALALRFKASGDRFPRGAVAWRVLVVALLVAFTVEEARLFKVDGVVYETVGLSLMPLAATMAMAGILAGLTPGRVRPRPRKWAALSVLFAGIAGVAIVASWSLIPYLILLALEAVSCAKHHPDLAQLSRAGLHERVIRSAWEAVVVLGCCMVSGVAVSRALRRRDREHGVRGTIGLLAATFVAAAGSAWLLAVTIPRLHEHLAEGLSMTVTPPVLAAIVLGFAGVAAGLVARVADQPGGFDLEPRGRRWPLWLLGLLCSMVALGLLAVSVDRFVAVFGGRVSSEPGLLWHVLGGGDRLGEWFQWVVSYAFKDIWATTQGPEWIALALAQAWVGWRIVLMLLKPPDAVISPLDAALCDRRALGRFAAPWVALTVLMVAALPALFVTGVVLLHGLFRLQG